MVCVASLTCERRRRDQSYARIGFKGGNADQRPIATGYGRWEAATCGRVAEGNGDTSRFVTGFCRSEIRRVKQLSIYGRNYGVIYDVGGPCAAGIRRRLLRRQMYMLSAC